MSVKAYIEYTAKLDGGEVVDSNVGSEPLCVVLGSGDVPEPLMRVLETMGAGDRATVSVPYEKAYGPYNPKSVLSLARCRIRDGYALRKGQQIVWHDSRGAAVPARVVEADEEIVRIDFNHPLAGKDIIYDVCMLDTA